jgi:hypothetical protein
MRVRVNDPALLPDLLEYLGSSPDIFADAVSEDEVEISLLGSFALEAMRMEIYLRIRAWEAAARTRAQSVELLGDP